MPAVSPLGSMDAAQIQTFCRAHIPHFTSVFPWPICITSTCSLDSYLNAALCQH
jgi:hypothetical protein